jgi:hypothetical protein
MLLLTSDIQHEMDVKGFAGDAAREEGFLKTTNKMTEQEVASNPYLSFSRCR